MISAKSILRTKISDQKKTPNVIVANLCQDDPKSTPGGLFLYDLAQRQVVAVTSDNLKSRADSNASNTAPDSSSLDKRKPFMLQIIITQHRFPISP